jgi:zinc transport system substrate-binding protein
MAILLFATNTLATPNIVVSIKPIHSIVSSLTQGITEPKLLLTANQSPEHAYLKPSQLSLLNQADLTIFIHPIFESGLKKAMDNLSANKKFISGNIKNIFLIHNKEDEEHEGEEQESEEGLILTTILGVAKVFVANNSIAIKSERKVIII